MVVSKAHGSRVVAARALQDLGTGAARLGTAMWWARLAAVGGLYYACARLGLLIPYVGTHVSLVWLPTGVAVAACFRWGSSMSLAVFVAAVLANLSLGGPAWIATGIGVGNALGPAGSAWLLRHWRFDAGLARRRDLALFLLAVAAGMVVTASNGTAWLWAGGLVPAAQLPMAWLTWWLGDAVGALLGGVPLVALNRRTARATFVGGEGAINGLVLGAVLLCGLLSFSDWAVSNPAATFPLLALPFFLSAILALRSGALSASLAVLVLSVAAAWGTARGVGPFVRQDGPGGLLALWSYLTAQACSGLLIWSLAAALLSSRRQLAALFDHANEAILVTDAGGLLQAMNPAAARLLGVAEPRAALGRPLAALPHGHGAVLAQWLAADEARLGAPGDLLLRQPGGGELAVELQAARYRDANGQRCAHLLLRDVSARRDAEARVLRSEQRLRAITDNMPALICYLDLEHRFRFANATYREWFGLDPATLIGQRIDDQFEPHLYAERRPYIERALRTGERLSYEMEVQLHGQPHHLRSTYVPDRGADGQVQGLYVLIMDITELKAVEAALNRMARVDHLTGLPNRHEFDRRLVDALAAQGQGAGGMALLFIDVDHFKAINDGRGHAAGDAVLREFTQRLQHAVRASDTVARLAGDEFVVLLEGLHNPGQAEAVAAKVCAAMLPDFAVPGGPLAVRASVGVAWCEAGSATTSEALLATADTALYAAKHAGRDTFRLLRCDTAGQTAPA